MGEVYLARDTRLNRNVALKILSSDSTQDENRKRRFTQEARSASSLNHPNILTIHDFGTVDGISYLVSELIEGESLRAILKTGCLPIRRLLDIGIQISDGLAAAHHAGIVHRDLKPENIMVTPGGRAKILDFGLAKTIDPGGTLDGELANGDTSDGERTQPGLILGTLGYMSPEQARGLPAGFQSDQFALGVILHEMATGQHPFRRETPMQTLLEIANLSHVPFTPGPVAFRLLVGRCLSRDPKSRFEDTTEIRERLKRISDELPDKPGPPACETDKPKPKAKRELPRWLIPSLYALLIFGLGMLAARLLGPAGGIPDLSEYRFTPLASYSSVEGFPALSPNGKLAAYAADVNGVFQIFTQPLKSAIATPLTHSDNDCFFPFWAPHGKHIYYISQNKLWSVGASGGSPELVFDDVARASISRDGKRFALLRNELWFSEDRAAPKRYDLGPFHNKRLSTSSQLAFAPNGQLGLWTSDDDGTSHFWIIPAPDQAPHEYLENVPHSTLPRVFTWMPDSAHILYSDGHLWMAHVTTGSLHEITADTANELTPAVSADGKSVAFASTTLNYSIKQIPLDGNNASTIAASGFSPAWSPATAQYAYVTQRSGQPEIWLKDTRSGWERPIVAAKDFSDRTFSILDLAFSPGGERIAYRRAGLKSEAIWISTLNGEAPLRIAHEPDGVFQRGPTWSPDGNWIAYCSTRSGHNVLMKARADGSGTQALLSKEAGASPSWSPRGDTIATLDSTRLLLFNADGSGSRHTGDGAWLSITWSKDGNLIYGLRRTPQRHLELAALDPRTGTASTRTDLGAYPGAFSYATALGVEPIRGASLSPDGKTLITSTIDLKSSVWLLNGYKK